MDGAPSITGGAGMSAPENRQVATKAVQMARKGVKKWCEDASNTAAIA